MKESGKERLKSTIYESTRAPLTRSPFPNGEGKSVAASPPFWLTVFPYRQPSPRGEGAPKGRIGHRQYEREWENASQVDDLRKHPIHRSAVPLPQWGRLRGATLRVNFLQRAMSESGGDSDMGKRISNIRGSQPRLATLDSPFQRKGRECGAF